MKGSECILVLQNTILTYIIFNIICTGCPANTYKAGTDDSNTCNNCPNHSTTSGATGATSKNKCVCSAGYEGNPGGPCTRKYFYHMYRPHRFQAMRILQSIFRGMMQMINRTGHEYCLVCAAYTIISGY